MRISDLFTHAFVLNLDSEPNRWQRTTTRLWEQKIRAERFSALMPAGLPDRKSRGELGCTMSHHAAVRLAQERGYESIAIFEDDIIFHSDFDRLWPLLAPQLSGLAYDLFYFYDWEHPSPGCPEVRRLAGTLCAHAYVVHREFYAKFLEVTRINGTHRCVLDQVLKAVPARKWCTRPNLIGQDAGPSTIYPRTHVQRWSAHDG